jgi:peptidoglycan/LPS O-acetylase OafA/YrhL
MLAVVSAAIWAVWPAQGAADYSLTLAAASVFAANFAFAAFVDFFGPIARGVPLLHLWAVALAAQVLAALALIHAAAARFGPDRLRLVLIVLTVVSYWSGVWGETTAPERAWYMPHMRAWELLIGALLVFGDLPDIASRLWRALLTLVGLAALGAVFLLFDGGLRQPGLATMIPVLGAAMVIYAGANPVSALLDARPLAALGAAAFSVYLWHWPILVIARSLAPGPGATLAALAVAGAAAAASYWWLERPFRGEGPHWRALALAPLGLAALFAAGVVGVAG